jgi:hypothetical protein
MTIGRASLSTDPRNISQSGDQLTFTIDINPGTLAEAKAIRQQLLGLTTGEVIPVTWSGDSDFDGFYKVVDVLVTPDQANFLSSGFMRSVVSLSRIRGGYGVATAELVSRRTTDATVETLSPGHSQWVPAAATAGTPWGSASNKVTPDGEMRAIGSWTATGAQIASYRIAPADFYIGAATIEVYNGSEWVPVVGRQVPLGSGLEGVRLNNGVIRVGFDAQSGGDPRTTISRYNGSGYDVLHEWEWTSGGAATVVTPDDEPYITRNDVEAVSLLVPFARNGNTKMVGFTLERGASGLLIGTDPDGGQFDLDYISPGAAVSVEYSSHLPAGHRATTADADGNDWYGIPQKTGSSESLVGHIDISSGDLIEIGVEVAADEAGRGLVLSERQRIIT